MALVLCPKHPGAPSTRACPHVISAIVTGQFCLATEYREYSAIDGDLGGFSIGGHLCDHCITEYALPAHRTAFSDECAEKFLERSGDLFQPTCGACFDEWQNRDSRPAPRPGFIDPALFPFVGLLEANWASIRDEYLAISADSFDPWVQRHMHGSGWTVFGLFALGRQIAAACQQCPRTATLLQQIPGMSMAGFSRLAPSAHVKPHVGWAENVYRLHLGLVVPPGCRLRVGSETQWWEEGRCLIFDDTVEHEAWNSSDSPRGVLMLDFLRPGVSGRVDQHIPEEVRQYVNTLFAAQR